MNFDLTSEQEMIKRTIREFADEEVAPGAIERDQNKAVSIRDLSEIS